MNKYTRTLLLVTMLLVGEIHSVVASTSDGCQKATSTRSTVVYAFTSGFDAQGLKQTLQKLIDYLLESSFPCEPVQIVNESLDGVGQLVFPAYPEQAKASVVSALFTKPHDVLLADQMIKVRSQVNVIFGKVIKGTGTMNRGDGKPMSWGKLLAKDQQRFQPVPGTFMRTLLVVSSASANQSDDASFKPNFFGSTIWIFTDSRAALVDNMKLWDMIVDARGVLMEVNPDVKIRTTLRQPPSVGRFSFKRDNDVEGTVRLIADPSDGKLIDSTFTQGDEGFPLNGTLQCKGHGQDCDLNVQIPGNAFLESGRKEMAFASLRGTLSSGLSGEVRINNTLVRKRGATGEVEAKWKLSLQPLR